MDEPAHPGFHIRATIIPKGMSVKKAAELLGVGRPALSNLLNGRAGLSTEMAARLEKAFGADPQELLKMQAEFEQHQQLPHSPMLPVGAYVPSYLKITAKEIEQWAGRTEARSHLAVLLRKLVNSTGLELTRVDFPGYDNAENKGRDGWVEAGSATQWIPLGKSGWEFGCSQDCRRKADHDFEARVGEIPKDERLDMTFIFVTPRNWKEEKDKWIREKEALGEWASVRAYDASDLEQWLEQSIQAQGWLAERMDLPRWVCTLCLSVGTSGRGSPNRRCPGNCSRLPWHVTRRR